MEKLLFKSLHREDFLIPYSKSALLDLLHRESRILKEEYRDEGVFISALIDDRIHGLINQELRGE